MKSLHNWCIIKSRQETTHNSQCFDAAQWQLLPAWLDVNSVMIHKRLVAFGNTLAATSLDWRSWRPCLTICHDWLLMTTKCNNCNELLHILTLSKPDLQGVEYSLCMSRDGVQLFSLALQRLDCIICALTDAIHQCFGILTSNAELFCSIDSLLCPSHKTLQLT